MISDETLREVEAMAKADAKFYAEQEQRREAAYQMLWFNGDGRGREPGSFITKLLEAWTRADMDNDARLRLAFPTLGMAVEISRTRGSDALAEWAGIE